MIADGKHILSDAISSIGLVIGIGLMFISGWLWLDAVLTILFAGVIIFTGFQLVRKAISGVMDEADIALLSEIIHILVANRKAEWIDIHNLRVIQYGRALHIDSHVTMPWYWDVRVCTMRCI